MLPINWEVSGLDAKILEPARSLARFGDSLLPLVADYLPVLLTPPITKCPSCFSQAVVEGESMWKHEKRLYTMGGVSLVSVLRLYCR